MIEKTLLLCNVKKRQPVNFIIKCLRHKCFDLTSYPYVNRGPGHTKTDNKVGQFFEFIILLWLTCQTPAVGGLIVCVCVCARVCVRACDPVNQLNLKKPF